MPAHRAALAALLILATATPGWAIDPKYLPDDTEALVTINLRQLLDSPLAKGNAPLIERLQAGANERLTDLGVQRYLDKIGFELFRDLDTVTVATAGGKSPDFVLLEGRFNQAKIQAVAVEASKDNTDTIKPLLIGPHRALELRAVADGKPIYAGLVGDGKLIAASTPDRFVAALTRLNAAPASKLKKELRDPLAASSASSLQIVATGNGLARLVDGAAVNDLDALQRVLKDIAVLNVVVCADHKVTFSIDVQTRDKRSTDQMVQLTSVALAGAKLLAKKNSEKDGKATPALDVIQSVHVSSQGTQLVVRGEFSAHAVDAILKSAIK